MDLYCDCWMVSLSFLWLVVVPETGEYTEGARANPPPVGG